MSRFGSLNVLLKYYTNTYNIFIGYIISIFPVNTWVMYRPLYYCRICATDRHTSNSPINHHVSGNFVSAHRWRGRVVLLRAGRWTQTTDVYGIWDERGADGVIVSINACANTGGIVPGRTNTGSSVAVPIRFRVA